MFMSVVNAIVAGILGALIADAAGAPAWWIAIIGALFGLSMVVALVVAASRKFAPANHESRFPTPPS